MCSSFYLEWALKPPGEVISVERIVLNFLLYWHLAETLIQGALQFDHRDQGTKRNGSVQGERSMTCTPSVVHQPVVSWAPAVYLHLLLMPCYCTVIKHNECSSACWLREKCQRLAACSRGADIVGCSWIDRDSCDETSLQLQSHKGAALLASDTAVCGRVSELGPLGLADASDWRGVSCLCMSLCSLGVSALTSAGIS